jgi:hypothetical protein
MPWSFKVFYVVKKKRKRKSYLKKSTTYSLYQYNRCTNQNCLKTNGERFKLWNRDLAAVMNFNNILCFLRDTRERPSQFSREFKTTGASKRKSDSSPPPSSRAKLFKSS